MMVGTCGIVDRLTGQIETFRPNGFSFFCAAFVVRTNIGSAPSLFVLLLLLLTLLLVLLLLLLATFGTCRVVFRRRRGIRIRLVIGGRTVF